MTTTPSAVGAASHYDMNWPNIDWGKAHRGPVEEPPKVFVLSYVV
jgi:hypothetical protein